MADHAQNPISIQAQLETLLQAHGVQTIEHNDWVTQNGEFPAFRGTHFEGTPENPIAALDIEVMFEPESLMSETFAAIGDNTDQTVADALTQFSTSTLHPILSLACNIHDDQQTMLEKWPLGNGRLADVAIGNIATRFSKNFTVPPPPNWLTTLQQAANKISTGNRFNWISAYSFRMGEEPPTQSLKLNNEDWPAGLELMRKLDWPVSEGWYGMRLFILIRSD